MSLRVDQLWRYPVKSLAGEPLESAQLTPSGILGDRIVHVRGPEGVRTSRIHHRMLGLAGTLDTGGRPLINGLPWEDADALALIRVAAGNDAWLAAYEGPERFDILGPSWSRPMERSPRSAETPTPAAKHRNRRRGRDGGNDLAGSRAPHR